MKPGHYEYPLSLLKVILGARIPDAMNWHRCQITRLSARVLFRRLQSFGCLFRSPDQHCLVTVSVHRLVSATREPKNSAGYRFRRQIKLVWCRVLCNGNWTGPISAKNSLLNTKYRQLWWGAFLKPDYPLPRASRHKVGADTCSWLAQNGVGICSDKRDRRLCAAFQAVKLEPEKNVRCNTTVLPRMTKKNQESSYSTD